MDTLLSIIPKNPIQAMANGDMLALIFFSVFIGIGIAALGKKVKTFHSFLEQGNEIMMVFGHIDDEFRSLWYLCAHRLSHWKTGIYCDSCHTLYVGCRTSTIYSCGSHLLIDDFFIAKRNPIEFFKGFFPAIAVAFSTSSSSAALPVSMKTAQENLRVPKSISSFVQPLGATINMDGTAIMQGLQQYLSPSSTHCITKYASCSTHKEQTND